MTTLHLGVADLPYQAGAKARTTHGVAMILEQEYGLFSAFWGAKGGAVADLMVRDLERAITSGKQPSFAGALSECEHLFKQFISSREAERVGIPGTPTAAALRGVNHRLAHPYAKANPRRPSFRDTGLLQASFKAWVTR